MKIILNTIFLAFMVLLSTSVKSIDISVTTPASPINGCDLSATTNVTIILFNNSGTNAPAGLITAFYTINGGVPVSQVIGGIPGNASFILTFTVQADVSECGENYAMKAWIDFGLDLNQNNDTLWWNVQNDCTVIPGNILSNMTVCASGNEDTLRLNGWQNGYIDDWQYSDNGGVSWNGIGTTDTFHIFNNIPLTAQYRVVIDGGFCPNDTSTLAIVTVQPSPIGGAITGAISVCAANSSGLLELVGNSGTIIEWQSTTDNGTTWTSIPNATNDEAYINLSQTTWYRVLIDGGFCPDIYSDIAYIFVETTTDAGTLFSDTALCENEAVDLELQGNLGNIVTWETSIDGVTWTDLAFTNLVYNTGPLTAANFYRVIVQNGICPEDTSNVVFVNVFPLPIANAGVDTTITEGDTISLSGSGGVTGIWTPGDYLSDSTIEEPLAYPIETTNYTYTVISVDGCIASDQMTIFVDEFIPPPPPPAPIPPFSVMNVVTPNDDGYNDSWIIEGVEAYPSTAVQVYNIYGYEIFKSDDYQNDWDATFKGKTLPNGTYFYVVIPGGTDSKLKGTLTVFGNE